MLKVTWEDNTAMLFSGMTNDARRRAKALGEGKGIWRCPSCDCNQDMTGQGRGYGLEKSMNFNEKYTDLPGRNSHDMRRTFLVDWIVFSVP